LKKKKKCIDNDVVENWNPVCGREISGNWRMLLNVWCSSVRMILFN
jgi:hypothetical protein